MPPTFEKVQAAPVLATVRRLEQRIGARFPQRGLLLVAGEPDAVVLDTVSTIETLTVSLERKIWQKIAVLNAGREMPPAS